VKPRKPAPSKLQQYLAALPPETRRRVQAMRRAIREAAPDATESISYGIPAFKLDGRVLVYCAGWKHHTSFYPITPAIRRAHVAALKAYATSKGTVRFPLTKPLPVTLLKQLVRTRVAEVRTLSALRARR
jgi:uncharacterized protein YdhG (YjbR/CyaY superfamily)